MGEHVGLGKIIGVSEASVSEPEDVAAKNLASPRFLLLNKSIVMPDPVAWQNRAYLAPFRDNPY
jgi:hypothetical protein